MGDDERSRYGVAPNAVQATYEWNSNNAVRRNCLCDLFLWAEPCRNKQSTCPGMYKAIRPL